MTKKLITLLSSIALLASLNVAKAQQGPFPNYPIVGGASYCSSSVNAVCVQTIPAGPTSITGNEQLPANSELSNAQQPQAVLIPMAAIGALPVTVVALGAAAVTPISASNISGGVIFNIGAGVITAANITLPASPIDGQQYAINANATISTLSVSAGGTNSMAKNTAPTALTASTTGSPQGYLFRFNRGDTSWYRLQ